MKIQLEHKEIKINVELEGIESTRLEKLSKNIFNAFLDSIHIVNSEATPIIEEEAQKEDREQIENIEQPAAAADQVEPAAASSIVEPEDDQTSMAAALEAYEQAQATEKAKAELKTTSRPRFPIAMEMLKGLHDSTYKQQGGRVYLQAFIICNDCRHKDKHYIERGIPFVNCRNCGKRNMIRPATTGLFPHVDAFGNFYIGGAFKRADEREQNLQAVNE